jgi:hypothetical protein
MSSGLDTHPEVVWGAHGRRQAAWASAPVRALAWGGGLLAAGTALFLVYERLSATVWPDADSANAVLQGQSMASGNALLHGWVLSGASFYLTDLPVYALVVTARGVSSAAAHDAGAAIYALLVVTACLLAGAGARGRERVGRMALTLVLLVAPAAGVASALVLLGPFHAGTTVVILLSLLVLGSDTGQRGGLRLLRVAGFSALTAAAVISDALALYVAVVPVIVVAVLRLARRPDDGLWEWWLLAAAALAELAALTGARLLQAAGGFTTAPVGGALAGLGDLPHNLWLVLEGVLALFGTDVVGQPPATVAQGLLTVPRVFGLAFALACVVGVAVDWWRRREADRVVQILVVAIAIDLAAYAVSNQAVDLRTSRYLVPGLAFAAVLAGRHGTAWLRTGWRRWLAMGVGLAYVAAMPASLAGPAPGPSPAAEVGAFLEEHQLRHGLARYWQASTVTLETGGQVQVRAIDYGPGRLRPYWWEVETTWYDPRAEPASDARFVLVDTADARSLSVSAIEATFGLPSVTYRTGRWLVLVWDRNLLSDLGK